MEAIYKFHVDCGRMGELEGVFSAESDDVDSLIDTSQEVYFGEVLGKHSEVVKTMKKEYFTLITTDTAFIELFNKYELSNGFNPFEYLDEEDGEESYDEDEEDED